MWTPTRPVSWVSIDFEWYATPGILPVPRVFTAIESTTGRVHRLAEQELQSMRRPPFALGPDIVVCSYSIAADMVPWLVLNWELPEHVVCTYAETRVRYNGVRSEFGDDLLGACARRNITYAEARETKDFWHKRFQDPRPLDLEKEAAALDYCFADTEANLKLAQDYEPDMWWERALQYGEYCKSAAVIEHNGVGVYDRPLSLFRKHHAAARLALIEEGDRVLAEATRQALAEKGDSRAQSDLADLGCYEKDHLRNKRIWAFAQAHGIVWQSTICGGPVG